VCANDVVMSKATPKTSEKLTRKQIIDRRLTAAGWSIVSEKKFDSTKPLKTYNGCAIEEYETPNGPADYALCVDGKILGIVEAKWRIFLALFWSL
jgi:type I restriction enzyme R subunit